MASCISVFKACLVAEAGFAFVAPVLPGLFYFLAFAGAMRVGRAGRREKYRTITV